jgi:hypothetical protein
MPRIESHHGAYIVHGRDYGPEGTLVQTDYDYPSLAESCGWSLSRVQMGPKGKVRRLSRASKRGCPHRTTDGTVGCYACGLKAGDFISAAAEFLDGIAE